MNPTAWKIAQRMDELAFTGRGDYGALFRLVRREVGSMCSAEGEAVSNEADELRDRLSDAGHHATAAGLGLDVEARKARIRELESELAECRREAEHLLYALMELLPVTGSWTTGYKVSERIDATVTALPEEWVTAAMHFCELHRALASRLVSEEGKNDG